MAKTETQTETETQHTHSHVVPRDASAIIYNILIELDAAPGLLGSASQKMADGNGRNGQWPRSKMHFKCRLAELWHLAAQCATGSSGKTKRMAHPEAKGNRT